MSRRILDIAAAVLGLVVLAPVLALVALCIKLTSPGPVLFRQSRLGLSGRPFRMCKFRSMVSDAERDGMRLTAGGDARITPLGRILRRTKLDELPQLLNVLKGEMSLVGPRPEVAEFATIFPTEYERILTVKPGITHRATLAFRNEEAILSAVRDPRGFYIDRVMPRKLAMYTAQLDGSLLRDVGTICETILPWKATPAVVVSDLLDAPLVANIPPYPTPAPKANALPASSARLEVETRAEELARAVTGLS